jgi:outer membrane protein, heavy metal efflux system
MFGAFLRKRRVLKVLALGSWLAFPPHPARPAETQGVSNNLSWPEVWRRLQQHPALAEAQARLNVAHGALDLARQFQNPNVEVTLGQGQGTGSSRTAMEWGVKLEIGLQEIWQRPAAVEIALAGIEGAGFESQFLGRKILAQVRSLFFVLYNDQGSVELLGKSEAQMKELVALVRLRVDKGEARPADLLRAENEYQRVRIEMGQAKTMLSTHRQQMRLFFPDLSPDFTVQVVEGAEHPLPEREVFFKSVVEAHPLLGAGRAHLRELAGRLEQERSKRIPQFGLSGFYEQDLERQAYGGGLWIELPVWNWNQGGVAQARAEFDLGEARQQSVLRDLQSEALDAYQQCLQAEENVRVYREEILPHAQQSVEASERLFQIGEIGLMDVLDTGRVLFQARREYQEAQLQWRLSTTRLQTLNGEIAHEP